MPCSMLSWNSLSIGPGCSVLTRMLRRAAPLATLHIRPTWGQSGGGRDWSEALVHVTGLREKKQTKCYKQFLVTLSVTLALTNFVRWVLRPLFQTMPFLR